MNAHGSAHRHLIERIVDARRTAASLDIQGGGTKGFYGNARRGDLLDVRALAGITAYEPTELFVTALAGTPLVELERELASRGQCLPFEPPRFAPSGTVGGMVAAGLSGPARASTGPLRDYVLGATVLNGVGELLTFGGQVMKNVAGYDLSRVFAGSMGILGVICEVSFKVMPVLPATATLRFDIDDAGALLQLNRWGAEMPITASAWYRSELTVRLAGATAAVRVAQRRAGGRDLDPYAADSWWSDIRDHRHPFFAIGDAQLARGECLWRISVPATAPPLALAAEQFMEWHGAQRWLRSSEPAGQIRSAAAAVGGHATLVRAADKSSGAFDAISPALMNIHRRMKQSFDPAGIFNPGRLYAEL